jgi:hypothetical protein
MSANPGTPYELLVQQIFLTLVNQGEVRNIDVKHNVTLNGLATSHQVDVYWEFELGDVLYRTVVQAKDWNAAVDQGELLKFKSVLDDFPGQPRGIVVTRSGYQRGAKSFADTHGILLSSFSRKPYNHGQ